MNESEIFEEMREIGRMLESRRLILSARSGNMSVRIGDTIYIKRSGAMMGYLKEGDIVKADIHDEKPKGASIEYKVHRAIYLNTDYKAIIHAHTPYAIVESMEGKDIEPVDAEGRYYFDKIPVLDVKEAISSDEVAQRIPNVITKYGVAIVKAHGTFAAAHDLRDAFSRITEVESACMLRYRAYAARSR
jgi:L-fuculose-phosphate aldolase